MLPSSEPSFQDPTAVTAPLRGTSPLIIVSLADVLPARPSQVTFQVQSVQRSPRDDLEKPSPSTVDHLPLSVSTSYHLTPYSPLSIARPQQPQPSPTVHLPSRNVVTQTSQTRSFELLKSANESDLLNSDTSDTTSPSPWHPTRRQPDVNTTRLLPGDARTTSPNIIALVYITPVHRRLPNGTEHPTCHYLLNIKTNNTRPTLVNLRFQWTTLPPHLDSEDQFNALEFIFCEIVTQILQESFDRGFTTVPQETSPLRITPRPDDYHLLPADTEIYLESCNPPEADELYPGISTSSSLALLRFNLISDPPSRPP